MRTLPTRARSLAVAYGVVLAVAALLSQGVSSAQPSPSPSPSASGPSSSESAIHLLNPSLAYDPGLDPAGGDDPPKVSDKLEVDTTYHIVAWQNQPQPDEIVEASIRYGGNETVIGTLARSPSDPRIWEMFWDVPQGLGRGQATITVALFGHTAEGFVQRGVDQVVVEMLHKDPPSPPDPEDSEPVSETVELSWPSQGGQLGFYKPRGGSWRAVVDGTVSQQTARVSFAYSTTPPGLAPEFQPCGTVVTSSLAGFGARPIPFQATCTLAFDGLPSKVTAIAAIAQSATVHPTAPVFEQEAADVHAVKPYAQAPGEMTIALDQEYARGLGSNCVALLATVRDPLERPVQGANIDVHLEGPDDSVQFGSTSASGNKPPDDRERHALEAGSNCQGAAGGQQGLHRVPGGNDGKHRESFGGSGLDGPTTGAAVAPGQWRFVMYSARPGIADVTAWVDDEPVPDESRQRPQDDDALEADEPSFSGHAQWFDSNPVVTLDPAGVSAGIGECVPYVMKLRSGTAAVPDANVDLHAQSKVDGVRFCTPSGGAALRAPDKGTHDPVDTAQSSDTGVETPTLHAEAETDSEGNLLFGLTSPTAGDATVTAWWDGEPETDNDVMAGAEARATATTSWADCSGAGHVSFISPSAYGETPGQGTGLNVSTKLDADEAVHVVVRSDCASFAERVEIQLANGNTFQTLGNAARIDGTDTYEFLWTPVPSDGSHRLRAHVVGAPADEEQTVTVNADDATGGNPTEEADETLELTKPRNGLPAPFVSRATEINGIASVGAEGVDLFYTKSAARDTPGTSDWITCGYVDLDGTGTDPQPFIGSCELRDPDQPSEVSAVAALSVDCGLTQEGCDAAPDANARSLPTFKKDSGDAHRVFGYEALPFVSIAPAENESRTGECVRFTLSIADDSSQPMPGENVDVHLRGPGDDAAFCAVGGATPSRPPTEGGHSLGHQGQSSHADPAAPDTYHVEGETGAGGRFVFGVESDAVGDSEITAWLDRTDDDFPGADETTDASVMHWIAPRGCTVVGTAGADRLRGTSGPDRVCGRGGNDRLAGLAGNDVILGGPGNDRLAGGRGNDVLNGGTGRDRLRGNGGRDRCSGGPQKDVLRTCERDARMATSRHL